MSRRSNILWFLAWILSSIAWLHAYRLNEKLLKANGDLIERCSKLIEEKRSIREERDKCWDRWWKEHGDGVA